MLHYPPAEIRPPTNPGSGVWSGNGNWKILLHTTETSGLPGYDGGATAPHLTYEPRHRKWYQHYYLNRPSEAVGTYDNDQLIQIEMICYSSKSTADANPARMYVADLPDTTYADIIAFAEWFAIDHDFTFAWPGRSANRLLPTLIPGFRMPDAEFYPYSGFLGHQHLQHNLNRYDPGAFDWLKLVSLFPSPSISDMSFAKGLDEAQWRTLYKRGIAKGTSADAVVKYWVTEADQRSDTEFDQASASMFIELSGKAGVSTDDVKGIIKATKLSP